MFQIVSKAISCIYLYYDKKVGQLLSAPIGELLQVTLKFLSSS